MNKGQNVRINEERINCLINYKIGNKLMTDKIIISIGR